MKVYTLQHIDVLKTLNKTGVYYTNEAYICEETFKEAYNWLNSMGYKYRPKTWHGTRPVWLWLKRPDMRLYRYISTPNAPKREVQVLLTFDIPESELLISEFGLWHSVLNSFPVAVNEKDSRKWDKILKPYGGYFSEKVPKTVKAAVLKSWEKILKIKEDSFKNFSKKWIGEELQFQAITPCLKAEYLVKVEKFTIVNKHKDFK